MSNKKGDISGEKNSEKEDINNEKGSSEHSSDDKHILSIAATAIIPEKYLKSPKVWNTLALVLAFIAVNMCLVVCLALALLSIKVFVAKNADDILQDFSDELLHNFTVTTHGMNGIISNSSISVVKLHSCSTLYALNPSLMSGYYLVRSKTGHLMSIYCDMTRTCGQITGGWTRVATLDPYVCPQGFKSRLLNGLVSNCIVEEDGPGCFSAYYSSYTIPYTHICTKIRGFRVGNPDGFRGVRGISPLQSSNPYDGILVSSGRKHIWSYISANYCVCADAPIYRTGGFTCDHTSCLSDRDQCGSYLWDSNKCKKKSKFTGWYYTKLPNPTSSDIEVKVCRDEERSEEDIPIAFLEIYVQ